MLHPRHPTPFCSLNVSASECNSHIDWPLQCFFIFGGYIYLYYSVFISIWMLELWYFSLPLNFVNVVFWSLKSRHGVSSPLNILNHEPEPGISQWTKPSKNVWKFYIAVPNCHHIRALNIYNFVVTFGEFHRIWLQGFSWGLMGIPK